MNWLNEMLQNDPDPQESREWVESLKAVIDHDGAARAHQLLEGMVEPLAAQITRIARGNSGRRTGEWSIAALATVTNIFTANNTVAILISGGVARDIAERHAVPPPRAASHSSRARKGVTPMPPATHTCSSPMSPKSKPPYGPSRVTASPMRT